MSPHARPLLIGLSPRLLHQVPAELGFRGKTLQYLEQSIAHWVLREGALVLMIPTVLRESPSGWGPQDVADYVDVLDGLVLQGGADVDPAIYGEAPSPRLGRCDPVRDRFELALIRAFVAAGKPVLGVCRGMQLINIAFGGTLYQDLIEAGITDFSHVHEAYDAHRHRLRWCDGSWLADLHPGVSEPQVNSIHHQGVKRLGDGLIIDAIADDGVVEALHHRDGFVVGVQWHPEFHDASDATLLDPAPLMRAFLGAAAQRRTLIAG